ncbi:Protein-export membrane protein SecD (TC 3.A.5.1.1) [hydrothermal vent metagenome]|uniref:Protein-export membrane protein SecD (TC 3.A.5.1.1) n=1 Tax=hydrothermal vent metagenome TaxID=652676 RepID=A0A1W1CTR5_9ZZZZ
MPLNFYPIWKNVLIFLVIVLGFIYAIPNIFGSDYAVQISSDKAITEHTLEKTKKYLLDKNISFKSIKLLNNKILIRLHNSVLQLKTQSVLKDNLSKNFTIALNIAPAIPNWLESLGAKPMYLGLDLRGGVHFLLEVDMDEVIVATINRYYYQVRTLLREKRLYRRIKNNQESIEVLFDTEIKRQKAKKILNQEILDLTTIEITKNKQLYLKLVFDKKALISLKKTTLKQNIITLRNRVNELGVAEPIIQQQGLNRIVVELPGVQDTAQAKEILGSVANLEFRMVDERNDPELAKRTGKMPLGSKLYKFRDGRTLLLKNRVIATGENITNAASGIDQNSNSPMVNLNLDAVGGRSMLRTTKKNLHKSMAVVFIENKVETTYRNGNKFKKKTKVEEIINVATIQGVFSNRFQITGLNSAREARKLALLLRAGSLSAPIEIIEERTVGPSLGQDNIDKGFLSVIIGFILVLLFMLFRYKVFGLIANIALSLNLVIIVAVLSLLQATLTLPGIAGIVLTVGMAVDANVLIFERIKEELKNNNVQKAIFSGYEKALLTISDSSITTLIAAIVLFGFGTGPIKGFAVTLSIGIVTSVFTAVIVSRAMINLIYGRSNIEKVKI